MKCKLVFDWRGEKNFASEAKNFFAGCLNEDFSSAKSDPGELFVRYEVATATTSVDVHYAFHSYFLGNYCMDVRTVRKVNLNYLFLHNFLTTE